MVTMTQAQSVSATFNLACPTEPAQNVPITSGETYYGSKCALQTTGDVDSFVFNASAGDTWRMVLGLGAAPATDICLDLYAPGGSKVFHGCTVIECCTPSYSVTKDQKLTVGGLYTIVVSESHNAAVTYGLSLERLHSPPPDGVPLVLSRNTIGEVLPPTAQEAYTFYGATSGTYQITTSIPINSSQNACMNIYQPDGTGAASACTNIACCNPTYTIQAVLTPTQDGTYVVVIYVGGNDGTVSYNLEVSCLVGTCPPPATLTVTKTGNGTVTSGDGFINCGNSCSYPYPSGTPVTLTATPTQGSFFISWNGCDSVNDNICNLATDSARTVTATFTQSTYLLTVATVGSGTITSGDGFINCPGTCSYSYPSETQVTLTATPGQGSTFSTWGGACSGIGPCQVNVTQPSTVNAFFYAPQQFIAVTRMPAGGHAAGERGQWRDTERDIRELQPSAVGLQRKVVPISPPPLPIR